MILVPVRIKPIDVPEQPKQSEVHCSGKSVNERRTSAYIRGALANNSSGDESSDHGKIRKLSSKPTGLKSPHRAWTLS